MRSILISSALFLLVCSFAVGQEQFLPILEDGRAYVEWTTLCDVGGGDLLQMNGDTILHDTTYKKLYAISCRQEWPILKGFLRTNVTHSKLWFTEDGNNDILL